MLAGRHGQHHCWEGAQQVGGSSPQSSLLHLLPEGAQTLLGHGVGCRDGAGRTPLPSNGRAPAWETLSLYPQHFCSQFFLPFSTPFILFYTFFHYSNQHMTDVYCRKATKPCASEVRAGDELRGGQPSAQPEVEVLQCRCDFAWQKSVRGAARCRQLLGTARSLGGGRRGELGIRM